MSPNLTRIASPILLVFFLLALGCQGQNAQQAELAAQQQAEIERLRRENQRLESARAENEEVRRLRKETERIHALRGQYQELQRLRQENEQLQAQLERALSGPTRTSAPRR